MKQKVSLVITFMILFFSCFRVFVAATPEFETESIILMDTNTGQIIYEKNGDKCMYPASTTKILTALLAVELGDPKDVVNIGAEVLTVPRDSSKAGHLPGEMILLEDLLMGLMLSSGNDSAVSIACYIAKRQTLNLDLTVNEALNYFAKRSNQRAKEIGARQTHFTNPHGYHDEDHYTTALDLALITKEAMKNPSFQKIVQTPSYTVETDESELFWKNTNLLLDPENTTAFYPYATGTKTGFTTPAGECLVASANKEGAELIVILLNSPKNQRWEEAKVLFEYGFEILKTNNAEKNKSIESLGKIKEVILPDESTLQETSLVPKVNLATSIPKNKIFISIKDIMIRMLKRYEGWIRTVAALVVVIFIFRKILNIMRYMARKN